MSKLHGNNEWSFSTPSIQNGNKSVISTTSISDSMSTCSILRSSSRYTKSIFSCDSQKKRVRIVSPIRWDINKQCTTSIQRRREFIQTTITYIELKQILRDLGYSSHGSFNECCERLLDTKWIPDKHHIEQNDKLRAKPIHELNERIIKLENGDIDYLSSFNINQLKKWLKHNNIKQPSGKNKYEYIKIINQHFMWRSPSTDSLRFRVIPNRPKCYGYNNGDIDDGVDDKNQHKTKTMSRTPRRKRKNVRNIDNMDIDQDDDDKINCMDQDCIDHEADDNDYNNDYDDNDDVRMQLCFDYS